MKRELENSCQVGIIILREISASKSPIIRPINKLRNQPLLVVSCFLFPPKSNSGVHYEWSYFYYDLNAGMGIKSFQIKSNHFKSNQINDLIWFEGGFGSAWFDLIWMCFQRDVIWFDLIFFNFFKSNQITKIVYVIIPDFYWFFS